MMTETWQERNDRIVNTVHTLLYDYTQVWGERDSHGRLTGNVIIPAEKLIAYLRDKGVDA